MADLEPLRIRVEVEQSPPFRLMCAAMALLTVSSFAAAFVAFIDGNFALSALDVVVAILCALASHRWWCEAVEWREKAAELDELLQKWNMK